MVAGLEADDVHFSVSSDVTRLTNEGLVAEDWNAGPNQGVVSTSILVFAVRKGNRLGIEGWDDLIADGMRTVPADPQPAARPSAGNP